MSDYHFIMDTIWYFKFLISCILLSSQDICIDKDCVRIISDQAKTVYSKVSTLVNTSDIIEAETVLKDYVKFVHGTLDLF